MTSEVLATVPYRSGCCVIHPEIGSLVRWRVMPGGGGQHASATRVGARDRGGDPRHADLLVLGTVITMDRPGPAPALAVSGGRVLALGSGPNSTACAVLLPSLELGDRWRCRAYRPAHVPVEHRLFDGWMDCSPFTNATFDAVVDRLRRAAAAARRASGSPASVRPLAVPGEPELTAAILDRVAPDNPVLVANASMHFLYANSRALAAAPSPRRRRTPLAAATYRANGALTGVVGEMSAIMTLLSAVPPLSHAELLDGLVGILARAASQGSPSARGAPGPCSARANWTSCMASASGRLSTRITTAQIDAARAPGKGPGCGPATATKWCAR